MSRGVFHNTNLEQVPSHVTAAGCTVMRSARAPTNVVHLRDRTVSWLRQPLPLKNPHHPMPRAIHGTWNSEIDARRRRYLEPDPIPKYGELTGW